MFVDSIILRNFRAYKGTNSTRFKKDGKNVFVIAGNNGFGKTTYLTSLVWCLYGKLMVDVDDKFRRDINDAQGYKNFAKANLNKVCAETVSNTDIPSEKKKYISKHGYGDENASLRENSQYYVEIHITDVYIPSIPCSELTIRRTYDYFLESENIEVLLDGHVNELAKEVGYDIFINDFVLSKDIAKFFLFDAEKIVNLAEVKSIEERRRLSTAYSEVLGIKKYEEIKKNLENLRIKFRRKSGSGVSQSKLEKLTSEIATIEQEIAENETSRSNTDEAIEKLRIEKESLQERLIREGNAISAEELAGLRLLLQELKNKDATLKGKLRDMLDIAPFAISGDLLNRVREQVDKELKAKNVIANTDLLVETMLSAKNSILGQANVLHLTTQQRVILDSLIEDAFSRSLCEYSPEKKNSDVKVLLDFSDSEANEFVALFDNIKYSFSVNFKQLVKDIRNNSSFMQKTQRKISAAEYDDGDAVIKEVRARKAQVDEQLTKLENESRRISELLGTLNRDLIVHKKRFSECMKLVKVDKMDEDKDSIAERLIKELTEFLSELKVKRKASLEEKVKNEIDILMHKTDFIAGVSMDIQDDIIEINLLDSKNEIINKEKLSKGEQQLYATAILKALVDESGISFPVFIDSPLQKFDSIHSKNIITKFYPAVSKQVVIFPLLGKELSETEYADLLPNVNSAYVIRNKGGISSFKRVAPEKIFEYVD